MGVTRCLAHSPVGWPMNQTCHLLLCQLTVGNCDHEVIGVWLGREKGMTEAGDMGREGPTHLFTCLVPLDLSSPESKQYTISILHGVAAMPSFYYVLWM